jgi:hypothetical protein
MNSFDFIEVSTIGVSNNIYVYLKCRCSDCKACSKGHFGNNCNETCDGCISELCNSSDGVCDIEDICKAGWNGLKCDKGKCLKLYKYS